MQRNAIMRNPLADEPTARGTSNPLAVTRSRYERRHLRWHARDPHKPRKVRRAYRAKLGEYEAAIRAGDPLTAQLVIHEAGGLPDFAHAPVRALHREPGVPSLRHGRAPRLRLPRARRSCQGGRPARRSPSSTRGSPSGGDDDPGGDPEPEPRRSTAVALLAGRDRHLEDSMARVGVIPCGE
jgi:hypothetical protein